MSERLSSSATREAILFSCYMAIQRDDLTMISVSILFARLEGRSSANMIELVLKDLQNQAYFSLWSVDEANKEAVYKPTPHLVKHVEEILSSEGVSLKDKLETIFPKKYDLPVSGVSDTWSPIKDDSENPAKQRAIEAVQDVIGRLEADNGFAASQPDIRNSILYSLKVGVGMLREYVPSREQITANILKPLKYVGDLFAKHTIGELAKKAIEKLLLWLSGL
jgi:hypothetical protein